MVARQYGDVIFGTARRLAEISVPPLQQIESVLVILLVLGIEIEHVEQIVHVTLYFGDVAIDLERP